MAEAMKKTKAELLEARAKREDEAKKRAEAHELLCLELEERFCTELGPMGDVWQLVNTDNAGGVGPICVKKPSPLADKVFQSRLSKGDVGPEDYCEYVAGGIVYPTITTWNPIAGEMPQLVRRVAAAITALFGYGEEKLRGK